MITVTVGVDSLIPAGASNGAGLQVGAAADDACSAANGDHQGTLRYFPGKDTLQVCNAEGEWKSAGGGVVDAGLVGEEGDE